MVSCAQEYSRTSLPFRDLRVFVLHRAFINKNRTCHAIHCHRFMTPGVSLSTHAEADNSDRTSEIPKIPSLMYLASILPEVTVVDVANS